MPRLAVTLALLLSFSITLGAQTTTDSSAESKDDRQHFQELVREIRALRADFSTASVAAQRVQIALYRLHQQEQLVKAASQKVDESRQKLEQMQEEQQEAVEQLAELQDQLKTDHDSPAKEFLLRQWEGRKAQIEGLNQKIPHAQLQLTVAEEQLKNEHARLDAAEELVAKLDAALAAMSTRLSARSSAPAISAGR
jgi:chromosome segregation ATPase